MCSILIPHPSGRMLPLHEAAELPHYIYGASIETIGFNNILLAHADDITLQLQGSSMLLNDCADHLCHQLNQNNMHIDSLHVHKTYIDSEDTK